MNVNLHLVPIRFRDAAAFITMWHRHLGPPPGCKYTIGAGDSDGVLRGVVIVGRPVARHYDDGTTLEVTRLATDGTPNCASMLYGAAWRAAKALGYRRLITYILASEETGASLRAAGYRVIAQRPVHRGWDRPSRPRTDKGSAGMPRTLFEVGLPPAPTTHGDPA